MDGHLLRFDKKKTYCFLDCETENLCLSREHNLPWQIGMIKVKGDKMIDSKDFYVGWERELHVSKEAARITRFSPTKYKEKALPAEEVFPTIKDWLENCDHIIGHNFLGFDLYLIKGYYEFMGEDYTPLTEKIIDTMCVARAIKLGLRLRSNESLLAWQYKTLGVRKKGMRSSLTALGKEYKIDHDYGHLHDAIVDLG